MSKTVTVHDIVNLVFQNTPTPPCTYKVDFSNIDVPKLHVLLEIMQRGARKLFGENIMPSQMTISQFELLQDYIKSIGYTTRYNYSVHNGTKFINIWFEEYKVSPPPLNKSCGSNRSMV